LTIQFVVLLTIISHLSFAGVRIILPLTALHHEASPFTVGIIVALLAAVPIVFAVRWGRFVDRVGVRLPMRIGASLVLGAMLLGWAVPHLGTLFVVSAVAGSGHVLLQISAIQACSAIGRPEDRPKNFSLLALAFSTSIFIGPILAGIAIDHLGHGAAFLVLSIGVLSALLLLNRKGLEIPRAAPSPQAPGKRRLADLWRIPALRQVFVVSGTLSVAWDLFTFVVPIHGSRIGLSASTIGIIIGAFGAAVFIVRIVLPFIAHRINAWRLLVAATLLSGTTLIVFPLVSGVPLLILLAFVLGVGLGGTQPLIMTLLYERAPAGRGAEAVGVRTLLLNFGQLSVPLAFGVLGTALGMAPAFWAMGASLVATWCWTRGSRQRSAAP
jgi:MFS family permease